MSAPDRSMLAGRIQGFGNVNPPPLEDETGATIAKRAVGRLGDMVGEEVMLTVEDFREKGAVGAVKDAVADAGDILIDGVSGIIGWIRGDPPQEEESEKTEDATKALSNGPSGAAYGISQASPTGGINAVWVMPEEADPQALAQLSSQSGSLVNQQADPRVPKNIQPYQPPASSKTPYTAQTFSQNPMQLPGGPMIAPYQPAPSGPGARPPPFVPGANLTPGAQPNRWGPAGYNRPAGSGGVGSSGSASSAPTGAKGFVERISKGEVLVGPDAAKRLVSQCVAAKVSGKQLSEIICERARRLYLGLDGGEQADTDAALARLLGLTDALCQQGGEIAKPAVEEIKRNVNEELLSLRSSAKHREAAEPMLRRLGLTEGPSAEAADLLGGGGGGSSSQAPAAASADLLGGSEAPPSGSASSAGVADLLGTDDSVGSLTNLSSSPPPGAGSLDPFLAPAVGGGSTSLLGLDAPAQTANLFSLDTGSSSSSAVATAGPVSSPAVVPDAFAGAAALASLSSKPKKDEDMFGFVGAEMTKASGKP